MPCYSSVKTVLKDAARIGDAISALGLVREAVEDNRIEATQGDRRVIFSRSGDTFVGRGDRELIAQVARKYAELGVRQWARSNGFSVLESDGRKLTVQRRR